MIYLNESHLNEVGIPWVETIAVIEEVVRCLESGEFVQPIKPYLRYHNPANRIIAMPAFVGGDIYTAGIKWIASFPGNIDRNLPRASSVVILNNAETGEPQAIINTALLSCIRTASVTGSVIKRYMEHRPRESYTLGMTGFGPIGRAHLSMALSMWGDRIGTVKLYDPRPVDLQFLPEAYRSRIETVDRWQDAYLGADLFLTCTVASEPYIDLPPKGGALLLNISLRDFKNDIYPHVRSGIVVDEWEEVCRQNTDIERLHLQEGLQKEMTHTLVDLLLGDWMDTLPPEEPVMFNPMGMAVFDVAMGRYYADKALAANIGQLLPA
ncbi:Zwa5B [Paenibacillus mucilaginosus 3016]|uniref:Zwa5B n=1 Tax=Paenibacillus mucilaginosus 3016 TaxID=1116391 RepID=H6NAX9_9BACL|nr:ornithine cyclodeaminase [Paenibacillus mucilaginosus]AFC31234.1 Zwa5B [Paenibacillus mucilaginosus 3016]WFA19799.1 2,3-diaminopropionate biosynthesis protein SbnB [Paenibacillus mucilaginosus]